MVLLTGGATAVASSNAFTLVEAERRSPIDAAPEGHGLVGIVRKDTVKKNSQDPMVELINNTSEPIDARVTLRDASDGTLYNNDGVSGDKSVTISLPVGGSAFADIEADVSGTIPYDISVSEQGGSEFRLVSSGSIQSETGNTKDTVRIKKPNKNQDFTADEKKDEFTLKDLTVQDIKAPTNLDVATLEVKVDGVGVVGFKEIDISKTGNNDTYSERNITIPNEDRNGNTTDVRSGTQYTLEVTAKDKNGVTDTETVDDTP